MASAALSRKHTLTQDRLKEIIHYDPVVGVFLWKIKSRAKGGRVYPGDVAGFIRNNDGYRFIGIDGRAYMACKLAWLYQTGYFPAGIIDHANRVRSDDRFLNLRPATSSQNGMNKCVRSDNKSGVTGVSFDTARGKWAARIRVSGKYVSLGRYQNIDDAIAARKIAEEVAFKEFAPVGLA